ncbi:hypothetical protein GX51_00855 [Blastomyces parvus]|uniref:Myb-like domain-containing protein n=1 Tax=Blastomyces parvus TaxID=2060905 RepID=A0A2B7XJZ3_9EURO|nr:hypothetical protein GX51_00855 [Blastomyces parvus]
MPSLPVVLKLGNHPSTLQFLRAMRDSSDSPDRLSHGGLRRDPWTEEQKRDLLVLRKEHNYMNLKDFQKTFFPDRTCAAVRHRCYLLNKARKQKASPGSSLSAGGSNNRRPQQSTIQYQYIYSDDESQAMSLDSESNAEDAGEECSSEQRTSSKASLNLAVSNTHKRKPSAESGPSRPSPSKLSRVPTVSIFTSTDPCSTTFSSENLPTTSNTNTPVDIGNNPYNHNHGNNDQVSSFSFKPTWMNMGEEDILQMFRQAKTCAAETKRAADLESELSITTDMLTRVRQENSGLLDIQKQHDDELEKTVGNLLKERETLKMQLREHNGKEQKLLDDIHQLKTVFNKIKVGASKVIHPDMWKSGGMDDAAAQEVKLIAHMEEMLNAKVFSETKLSPQVPSGDDLFLDAVE